MRRPHWTLAVVAAALAGCAANPIVTIDAPGFSVARSAAPAAEPQTMAEAFQKANHVRAVYYQAIQEQSGQTQSAFTGLVWLGTGIAALAAGHAHRDAILGASLIGGTAYGLSRTQLDARRVTVWTEGIKAIDCAKEASLPADIGELRRAQLDAASAALAAQQLVTRAARDRVQAEIDALSAKVNVDPSATEVVTKADAALADATRTTDAAALLLDASRGRDLSVTIDRVSSKVTEVINTIALDISAVKQVVGGLGGFAAILAPGAGVDTTLEGAFSKYGIAKVGPGAQSSISSTLTNAIAALQIEISRLAAAQGRVTTLLRNVNITGVAAALKKCDVAAVVAPLTLTPATLVFTEKTAGTKGVVISGGTAPYEVTMLDEAPSGFTRIFSGGFNDTLQVKVNDQLSPGQYRLRVVEASTAHLSQQLVVKIEAKAAPAAPAASSKVVQAPAPAAVKPPVTTKPAPSVTAAPAPAPSPAPAPPPVAQVPAAPAASAAAVASPAETEAAWRSLVAAMSKPGFTKTLDDVTFRVSSAELKSGRLYVTLKCDKPNAALPPDRTREELLLADKPATQVLLRGKAIDMKFSQIDLSRSASCVKL